MCCDVLPRTLKVAARITNDSRWMVVRWQGAFKRQRNKQFSILNKGIHYTYWHLHFNVGIYFKILEPKHIYFLCIHTILSFSSLLLCQQGGWGRLNCQTQLSSLHPKSLIIAFICIRQLGRMAHSEKNQPFSPQVHTTPACNL